jgi:hypothetical protein
MISTYGADKFKRLYTTRLPFEQFVGDSLGMSVDSLQERWLEYANANMSPESRNVIDSLHQAGN